jgi:hypothetical protein
MNVRNLILTVLLIVFALLVIGCGAAATPTPAPTATPHPGEALVTSRCSTCHPIGLVENSKFSAQGWQIVVERMVMAGASLNSDQQAKVVDYLAIKYPKE